MVGLWCSLLASFGVTYALGCPPSFSAGVPVPIYLNETTDDQQLSLIPIVRNKTSGVACFEPKNVEWATVTKNELVYADNTSFNGTVEIFPIEKFPATNIRSYTCQTRDEQGKVHWGTSILCRKRQGSVKSDDCATNQLEGYLDYQLIKFGLTSKNEITLGPVRQNTVENNETTDVIIPPGGEYRWTCPLELKDHGNARNKPRSVYFWFVKTRLNLSETLEYRDSHPMDTITVRHANEYICAFKRNPSEPLVKRTLNVSISADSLLFKSYTHSTDLKQQDKRLHENVTFDCGDDIGASTYVMWVKSSEHPTKDQNITSIVQHSGVIERNKYSFKISTIQDAGWYSCYLVNSTAKIYRAVYLKLRETNSVTNDSKVSDPKDRSTFGIPEAETGNCDVTRYIIVAGILFQILLLVIVIAIICVSCKRSCKGPAIENRQRSCQGVEMEVLSRCYPNKNFDDIKSLLDSTTKMRKHDDNLHDDVIYVCNSMYQEDTCVKDWEIPRENLMCKELPSGGNFGRIYRAKLKTFGSKGLIDVVVKTTNEYSTSSEVSEIITEIAAMKAIGDHPNVIKLLGACTRNVPIYAIIEFAVHGNLRDFLRRRSSRATDDEYSEPNPMKINYLSYDDLLSFARQIATGLTFLAKKSIIHGNLTAKSILVGDGNAIKISDYAIKRDFCSNDRGQNANEEHSLIRWMAPESLFDKEHSIRANVWSYGIVLWEIMTFGDTPYPSIKTNEDFIERLRGGYRMAQPKECPIVVYHLMRRCWAELPADRPEFAEIASDLVCIVEKSKTNRPEDTYITVPVIGDNNDDFAYYSEPIFP